MSKREKFLEEKIKEIAKEKFIFDIGSGEHRFQGLERYKDYFCNSEYKTIDVRKDFKPDIVADAHNLPMRDCCADAIICKSVFQFTRNPFVVANEIFRVLKPQGKGLLYLPFIYPYHGDGNKIKDYWRFSVDGIHELFSKFAKIETCPVKGQFETSANVLPFQRGFAQKLTVYPARLLDSITAKFQSGRQAAGYLVYVEK